jgi:hypothetical protein
MPTLAYTPLVVIPESKAKAIAEHDRSHDGGMNIRRHEPIYTDASGYKNGVGAAAWCARTGATRTECLGPLYTATVYLAALRGIVAGHQV